MLFRTGTIIELHDGLARVEFEPAAACGACCGGQACGLGPLLALFKPSGRRFRLDLPLEPGRQLHVGDCVRVSWPATELLKSTGLAYVLPLGAILAGAWLGGGLFPNAGDLGPVTGALSGLAIGGAFLASAGRRARTKLLF